MRVHGTAILTLLTGNIITVLARPLPHGWHNIVTEMSNPAYILSPINQPYTMPTLFHWTVVLQLGEAT